MKKVISTLLCCVIAISLIGCGKTNKDDTTLKTTNNTITKDKSESESSEKEIKLNQPFQVKTEYGDYSFIIKSVTKTNWWERVNKNKDKTVILLNIESENINFKKNNTGILLYDAFTVKDNNKYMLSRYSYGFDDINVGTTEIPPDTKSKISIPYVVENNATSVNIEFVRGGKIENVPITE